eukprot:9014-Heterococcus_DN1.PRE.1
MTSTIIAATIDALFERFLYETPFSEVSELSWQEFASREARDSITFRGYNHRSLQALYSDLEKKFRDEQERTGELHEHMQKVQLQNRLDIAAAGRSADERLTRLIDIEKYRSTHALAAAQQCTRELEAQIAALQELNSSKYAEHTAEIAALEQKHESELNELQQQNEVVLNATRQRHETQLATTREDLERAAYHRVEQAAARSASALTAAEREHTAAIEALQQQHETQLATTRENVEMAADHREEQAAARSA